MKLFFVLLFTVACNFYFEAATKETLEIFDIISSCESAVGFLIQKLKINKCK